LNAWQDPQPTGSTDHSTDSIGEAVLEEARDAAVAGDDDPEFDDELDDSGPRSTKDVPTWEDALSQLPRNGGNSTGSGKSSGGRKRRRRRRGRGGQSDSSQSDSSQSDSSQGDGAGA